MGEIYSRISSARAKASGKNKSLHYGRIIADLDKSQNELMMVLAAGSIEEYNALKRSSIADFLLKYELYVKDLEHQINLANRKK